MEPVNLRIGDLRKKRGISQQKLADAVGVSFQTVSKWENKLTMPDIMILPELAGYFHISVDQLLGLKPLPEEEYMPVDSDKSGYWNDKKEYLARRGKYQWNEDYLSFLIRQVWKIEEPVSILDCGCGDGSFGRLLLALLPEGSKYTGIDFNGLLIEEGRNACAGRDDMKFICGDLMEYESPLKYDIVMERSVMRHLSRQEAFLDRMISLCRRDGLVVCMDVNRELECDGLYIEGMEYEKLCQRNGFRKMWKNEYENQGRDYAVSMRIPELMKTAGLKQIESRMNDKVNLIFPDMPDYDQVMEDFTAINQWDREVDEKHIIERFMNHGMDWSEAQEYCTRQREIKEFLNEKKGTVSIVLFSGFMITFARK